MGRPGKTREQALAEAKELAAWRLEEEKEQGKPVSQRLDADKAKRKRMWRLLDYFKTARAGNRESSFPEAFEVLDNAFGGKDWQANRRAGEG